MQSLTVRVVCLGMLFTIAGCQREGPDQGSSAATVGSGSAAKAAAGLITGQARVHSDAGYFTDGFTGVVEITTVPNIAEQSSQLLIKIERSEQRLPSGFTLILNRYGEVSARAKAGRYAIQAQHSIDSAEQPNAISASFVANSAAEQRRYWNRYQVHGGAVELISVQAEVDSIEDLDRLTRGKDIVKGQAKIEFENPANDSLFTLQVDFNAAVPWVEPKP